MTFLRCLITEIVVLRRGESYGWCWWKEAGGMGCHHLREWVLKVEDRGSKEEWEGLGAQQE